VTRRWIAMLFMLVAPNAWPAADSTVATYTATYRVEYKGKEAGTSEFRVRYLPDDDVYEFTSSTLAKGLLKLARPNPAVDRSLFHLESGSIRPLEFWHEDGSRSGEDNIHIVFDWQRRIATVSDSAARRELTLPPNALDRGSLQVALMRDLAMGGEPGDYQLADEDSVASYVYTDNGTATIETRAGSHDTRVLMQQREGSSRATWLWVAPELRFLPVRIEQRRSGEVQTAFILERVEFAAPAP
jgi:hypothetical protein